MLFNSSATYSFLSKLFIVHLNVPNVAFFDQLYVPTPVVDWLQVTQAAKDCKVDILGKTMMENMIVLPMLDFNVILGMHWLVAHYVFLGCREKAIKFSFSKEPTLIF